MDVTMVRSVVSRSFGMSTIVADTVLVGQIPHSFSITLLMLRGSKTSASVKIFMMGSSLWLYTLMLTVRSGSSAYMMVIVQHSHSYGSSSSGFDIGSSFFTVV